MTGSLEHDANRLVLTGALLILGCAALGAWAAASVAIHLTTPKGARAHEQGLPRGW